MNLKRIGISAVSLAILAAGPSMVFAEGLFQDPLVKELGGDLPPIPRTPEELQAAYAKVLPGLIAKPDADDAPLRKIVSRAGRPGAEIERATLSKVLTDRLASEQSVPVKVMLLRHIPRIGRVEAVPAVSALLNDPDARVRECARRALAGNPTVAAANALRAAFDRAGDEDPKWKAALLNAIAYRQDAADADRFATAVAGNADDLRMPAMNALARVGGESAVATLRAARDTGSDAAKAAANDACLLLADRLASAGQKDAAASIYREYLSSPSQCRYAAIVGIGAVGNDRDVIALLDLFAGNDAQAKGAALRALAHRPSPALTEQIFNRLAKSDTTTRPWLLRALPDERDPRAVKAFEDALTDSDETVRLTAIAATARVGGPSAVPALLKSAAGKGEEQAAARIALEALPGQSIDDALLQRLLTGPVPERAEVIRAFAGRSTRAAVAPLYDTAAAAAADTDPALRAEAFKTLAAIAPYDTLPRAIALLVKAADDADREQATKTVVAVARKNDDAQARVAPLLAELDRADGAVKASLLSALGQLGGERSLAAIRAAVQSADEKTHEAGVRALTGWPDVTPLADLLTLAKDEKSNTLSVLSLRGYVRLVGLPSKRTGPETVKLYEDAFPAAKRPDEKKMILGGLGEIKDAKALEAVVPYLSDEALTSEACAAAIKIAKETWQSNKDLAKSAMTKVLEVTKNDAQKKAAKEILDKLTPPPPQKSP